MDQLVVLAGKKGDFRQLEKLIAEGASLEACDEHGRTSLLLGARNGHARCVKLLLRYGADVHIEDNDGFSALHLASYKGHAEIVKLLLNANADPRATNDYGYTPLHYCQLLDHSEVAELLINAGCSHTSVSNAKHCRKIAKEVVARQFEECEIYQQGSASVSHPGEGKQEEVSDAGSVVALVLEKGLPEDEEVIQAEAEEELDDECASVVCGSIDEALAVASLHSGDPGEPTQAVPYLAGPSDSIYQQPESSLERIAPEKQTCGPAAASKTWARRIGKNVSMSPQEAVSDMRSLIKNGQLSSFYEAFVGRGDSSLKPRATRIFASLPTITTSTTHADMQALGLWRQLCSHPEYIGDCDRYLPGRQVLTLTRVRTELKPAADFLTFDATSSVVTTTHRAWIVATAESDFIVQVAKARNVGSQPSESATESAYVVVPQRAIWRLNQRHEFKGDMQSHEGLTFEDGIRAKYLSPLTKAKLVEAAISMEKWIRRLNFEHLATDAKRASHVWSQNLSRSVAVDRPVELAEISEMKTAQMNCLRVIRDVIDMDISKEGGNSPHRFRCLDAGRLAYHGQGHCHFHASVLAAFLLPFCHLVGFELRYRHGSHCGAGVFDVVDHHHWIEITMLPSLESYSCDMYNDRFLEPLDRAYASDRYHPSSKRLWFVRRRLQATKRSAN